MNIEFFSASSQARLRAAIEDTHHAHLFVAGSGQGAQIALEFVASARLEIRNHIPYTQITHANYSAIVPKPGKSSVGVEEVALVLQKIHTTAYSKDLPKVVAVPCAELLTIEASNALLKSLEEPPPNTVFLCATSNKSAILPTILSRLKVLELSLAPLSARNQLFAGQNQAFGNLSAGQPEVFYRLLSDPEYREVFTATRDFGERFMHGNLVERLLVAKQIENKQAALALVAWLIVAFYQQSTILEGMFELEILLQAERHLQTNISPRFVLENMALRIESAQAARV